MIPDGQTETGFTAADRGAPGGLRSLKGADRYHTGNRISHLRHPAGSVRRPAGGCYPIISPDPAGGAGSTGHRHLPGGGSDPAGGAAKVPYPLVGTLSGEPLGQRDPVLTGERSQRRGL